MQSLQCVLAPPWGLLLVGRAKKTSRGRHPGGSRTRARTTSTASFQCKDAGLSCELRVHDCGLRAVIQTDWSVDDEQAVGASYRGSVDDLLRRSDFVVTDLGHKSDKKLSLMNPTTKHWLTSTEEPISVVAERRVQGVRHLLLSWGLNLWEEWLSEIGDRVHEAAKGNLS
ncbi:hypothetical protein L3Q82_017292, partial [Scortum barcoo]